MRAALFAALLVIAGACFGGDGAEDDTATTAAIPAAAGEVAETAPEAPLATPSPTTTTTTTTTTSTTTTTTTTTIPPVVGSRHGTVAGLTMFRGNPTRTYYGTGPVPTAPTVRWRYPASAMCSTSTVGGESTQWCGTGWTGQPVVWERPDGVTEVIFGAYDRAVHFVDGATGEATREPFRVGDLVKGSVTLDPDGYPILYFGSRDNLLRAVALDRDPVQLLWSVDARDYPVTWNDDWDSNPVVVDDVLHEGGENGWFLAWRLNRGYDDAGLVTLAPAPLVELSVVSDELRAVMGSQQSIESSVAVFAGSAFFATSAGRVMGVDMTAAADATAPVTFDFWMGDDVDATVVVDEDGALYVAAEQEKFTARSAEVGQLVKLDPTNPDDPIVWSVPVPPRGSGDGGLWATPALGDGVLYAATHPGELLAVDTTTGEVVWRDEIGFHAWSSPVVVDRTLVVAVDCDAGGGLRAYDVAVPARPTPVWELPLGTGCIESTPAVWDGAIYVGSRDGYFYKFG